MSQQPPMPDTTDTEQEKQKQERIDLVMKGLAKRLKNPMLIKLKQIRKKRKAFGDIEPNVSNSNKRKVSLMSIDEERETNTVVKSGKVYEVEAGINDGRSFTDDDDPLV